MIFLPIDFGEEAKLIVDNLNLLAEALKENVTLDIVEEALWNSESSYIYELFEDTSEISVVNMRGLKPIQTQDAVCYILQYDKSKKSGKIKTGIMFEAETEVAMPDYETATYDRELENPIVHFDRNEEWPITFIVTVEADFQIVDDNKVKFKNINHIVAYGSVYEGCEELESRWKSWASPYL